MGVRNRALQGGVTAAATAYGFAAAGCLALLITQARHTPPLGWRDVLLAVLALAGAVTITVPLGFGNRYEEIDLAGAGLALAIALIGPAPAAVSLIAAKSIAELVKRRRPVKAIANTSSFAIAAAAGSELVRAMNGSAAHLGPHEWPALAAAAAVFTVVLAFLINGIIHLAQHQVWLAKLGRVNLLNAAGDVTVAVALLAGWRYKSEAFFLAPALALGVLRLYRATTTHDDEGSVLNGLAKASTAVSTLDPRVAMTELADRCSELFGVTELEIDLLNWPPDMSTWRFASRSNEVAVYGRLDLDTSEPPASQKWWQSFPIVADDELLGELRMRAGERTQRRAERAIMDAFMATTTTALHHARGHLRELQAARRDPLTGLVNRAGIGEFVSDILGGTIPLDMSRARARHPDEKGVPEDPEIFALLFLDLDHFKPINDRYGHAAGDELLKNVARRLKNNLRTHDEVSRIGGDEFLIVLRDVGTTQMAKDLADSLLRRLREPMTLTGIEKTFKVRGTVGVATSLDGENLEDLKRCADIAMYVAKRNGRGTVSVYTPTATPAMPETDDLLDDLETAIPAGELIVHYQPKVDLISGLIVGSEALVRWQHPTRGLLGPGQFLPQAERHPVIFDLTMKVLETVITEAGTWRNRLLPVGVDPHVAVNVARNCLVHRDFPAQVLRLLAIHGVPSSSLTLEITESTELDTSETVDQVLAELRSAGIKLSVDDFGTGYSSMSFFQRVAVDEVKIDGQFVRGMLTSPASRSIVRSTVELGKGVGITVVAEGIETAEQLAEVIAAGADVGQGYYLGKPMPISEFRVKLHDCWYDQARRNQP